MPNGDIIEEYLAWEYDDSRSMESGGAYAI